MAAKSGCVSNVVAMIRLPKAARWPSRIEPSAPSLSTHQVTGSLCSTAVGSTFMIIWNEPSPTKPTAGRSGWTSFATGNADDAKPMP